MASRPGYGYNPVMSTIVDRMKQQLKGSCYPRPLSVNSDGSVPCSLVEVISQSSISPNGSDCNAYCESQGGNAQGAPSAAMTADVTVAMRAANLCDNAGNPACTSMCVCQLQQESGSNLATCQNATDGSHSNATPRILCYVDPSNGAGSNAAVVAQCPSTDRRLLRSCRQRSIRRRTSSTSARFVHLPFLRTESELVSARPSGHTGDLGHLSSVAGAFCV